MLSPTAGGSAPQPEGIPPEPVHPDSPGVNLTRAKSSFFSLSTEKDHNYLTITNRSLTCGGQDHSNETARPARAFISGSAIKSTTRKLRMNLCIDCLPGSYIQH